MNSRKSEDSTLPSHPSDRAACKNSEKSPAVKSIRTHESSTFSSPDLDQLRGLVPDFNNRLSPTLDLGLSPLGNPRLCSESHPRLVSDSALGLVSGSLSSPLSGPKTEYPETPVGKRLEVMPDLPGRTLAGDKVGLLTLGADLPIGLVESRLMTLSSTEEKLKNAEQDRK